MYIQEVNIGGTKYAVKDSEVRQTVDQIISSIATNNEDISQYLINLSIRVNELEEEFSYISYMDSGSSYIGLNYDVVLTNITTALENS